MQNNTQHLASTEMQAVTETTQEKFERERLSRRQALRKFGMASAMSTLALFSVDDLARMVGRAMEQRAADNKTAAQIATEFESAGVALASGTPSPSACLTPNACQGLSTCQCCVQSKICTQGACDGQYTIDKRNGVSEQVARANQTACKTAATKTAADCCHNNGCNC